MRAGWGGEERNRHALSMPEFRVSEIPSQGWTKARKMQNNSKRRKEVERFPRDANRQLELVTVRVLLRLIPDTLLT